MRSIDGIWEDNMVDDLFFCVTLTGHKGGHTPLHFHKQEQKHPTLVEVRRQLNWTQAVLGRVIPRG